jgi:hypothetical protein
VANVPSGAASGPLLVTVNTASSSAANIFEVPHPAISVINVLQGVGPFKDLESTIFPGNLADALDAIINHRRVVDLNNPIVVRKPKH